MCTFGVLGLSCETPAHLRVRAFKNTTKIPREDPQRETNRAKMGTGEEKKKREILGSPPLGPLLLWASPFGPTFRAPTRRTPTFSWVRPSNPSVLPPIGPNRPGQPRHSDPDRPHPDPPPNRTASPPPPRLRPPRPQNNFYKCLKNQF